MTNSPSSNSEPASQSFERLDPRIQRWIWSAGWTELRDAQEKAIPLILGGDTDVIIAASLHGTVTSQEPARAHFSENLKAAY
jgi:superfamily II DNA/RNA helicase